MTSMIDHWKLEGPRKSESESKMLGKRHEYQGAVRPSMRQTALLLGFSPKEISKLERIYVHKPMQKNHET